MEKNKGPNGSKVNANDAGDVLNLHRQFPECTHQEVVHAIQTQGPMKVDILNYLTQRQKDKDPSAIR